MVSDAEDRRDRELRTRIMADYLEMPGLNVTMTQGCRLWSIDRQDLAKALDTLLDGGFLRKSGDKFMRTHCGRWAA